ncbi:hypothetical protein DMJ13_21430 [halophilic archaeon]|nr:hypothetical protein DMJ13_21430 [halophilic archaeon]
MSDCTNRESIIEHLNLDDDSHLQQFDEDHPPSEVLLARLRELTDDLMERNPLYETIDLDALDALFTIGQQGQDGYVTFIYEEFQIVVSSSGHVLVQES